jgi:outer membrane protein assembly factor BamA
MPAWSIRIGVLLCLSLLAGTRAAAAGAPQESSCFDQQVTAVRLEVDGHPDYPQSLVTGLELRKDAPFTREAYRRSVDRLVRFGSFEQVTVLCATVPGGVSVTFAAVPPHRVTSVVFQGSDMGLTPAELEKQLRQTYNGLPNIEPQLVANEVTNILKDHGYPDAQVEVKRMTFANPDRAMLVFDVAAGPLARIGKVTIDLPNESAITRERVATMTGLSEGQPFTPGAIRNGLLDVVSGLKSKGYYLAATTEPEPQPAGAHTFDVSVGVTPGPRVTLAWDPDGDARLPGDIADWVPLKTMNTIDRDILDDSKARMKNYLVNEGHYTATVDILGVGDEKDAEWPLKVLIKQGPKFRINSIVFPPNLRMSHKDLVTWLDVREGDVRNEAKIVTGLVRIQHEYRHAGYYRVSIVPKAVDASNRPQTDKERWVDLQPEIVEGPKGQVVQLEFRRTTTQVPEAALRSVIQGGEGHPYVAELNVVDRVELERLYLNRGFRAAQVEITPEFSPDGTQVKRVFQIDEGPQMHVIDIQVVGWHDISEQAIREELTLRPGAPFSEAERLESQNRLNNMGVFRFVSVEPDNTERADPTGVRIIVRVVEAPDTTVAFGGGVEAGQTSRAVTPEINEERFEIYPRGSLEISRRNLGGRNRILSLFSRVSLRPHDAPHDPLRDGKGYALSQYRAALTYQERRAFGSDFDWLFGVSSEQAIRSKFNFRRSGANMDLTRLLSRRTRATARYALDFTDLELTQQLAEQEALAVDQAFPQVRLSTFGIGVISEQRDDPVSPSRGRFLAWDGEVAARAIGSEVGYLKTLAQASVYKSLVPSKRFIFAARAQLGLARGFERLADVPITNPDGTVTIVPTIVAELPASQRFYAGGSTTVRGFTLDSLGRPDVISNSGLSRGGNGLVVLNAELRTRIVNLFRRKLSTAIFVDSGNVFAKVHQMSLADLRGSIGYGFRYDSPLGPIRVDFGYKLSLMTFNNGVREDRWAYHISFGEIF